MAEFDGKLAAAGQGLEPEPEEIRPESTPPPMAPRAVSRADSGGGGGPPVLEAKGGGPPKMKPRKQPVPQPEPEPEPEPEQAESDDVESHTAVLKIQARHRGNRTRQAHLETIRHMKAGTSVVMAIGGDHVHHARALEAQKSGGVAKKGADGPPPMKKKGGGPPVLKPKKLPQEAEAEVARIVAEAEAGRIAAMVEQ